MQRQNRRHERRMPHLNNQIWIRTRFVRDNTLGELHRIVYLHIYKIHTSPFKITTSKAQRTNNVMTGKCFVFSSSVREAAVASSCHGKKNTSFVLLEIVLGYLSSMWRPLGQL